MPARASPWTDRRWPTGSVNPQHCWSPSPTRSADMSSPGGPSLPTTRPLKMQAKVKCTTARIWTYVRDERPWKAQGDSAAPPAAWYRFSADRKGAHPADHLGPFKGWMHADGYAGFNELYRGGDISEVACLAHIRRRFVDIFQSEGSMIAEEAIRRIAALYAVEKDARGLAPKERVWLRQNRAQTDPRRSGDLARRPTPKISGKSELAKAIRYALARMKKLRPYLVVRFQHMVPIRSRFPLPRQEVALDDGGPSSSASDAPREWETRPKGGPRAPGCRCAALM